MVIRTKPIISFIIPEIREIPTVCRVNLNLLKRTRIVFLEAVSFVDATGPCKVFTLFNFEMLNYDLFRKYLVPRNFIKLYTETM